MRAIEDVTIRFPEGFYISWTGLFFEERLSGSQVPVLYALSLSIVFLCLVALYESWSIPFPVVLVTPLGVLEVVYAALLRGLGNDVLFQVGLLTTIGLSAKNAMPIVEFVRKLYEKEGLNIKEAAAEAARVRLRPTIMTSLVSVMGVIPLVVSTGVSSGNKHAIGIGVVRGTITVTILAIFYIPLLYVLTVGFFSYRNKESSNRTETEQS